PAVDRRRRPRGSCPALRATTCCRPGRSERRAPTGGARAESLRPPATVSTSGPNHGLHSCRARPPPAGARTPPANTLKESNPAAKHDSVGHSVETLTGRGLRGSERPLAYAGAETPKCPA